MEPFSKCISDRHILTSKKVGSRGITKASRPSLDINHLRKQLSISSDQT
jgi:hypothetical protein